MGYGTEEFCFVKRRNSEATTIPRLSRISTDLQELYIV